MDGDILKVGDWIGVTDDGLWRSIFDENDSPRFSSKGAVIKDIGGAKLDSAKNPRVKRVTPGKYFYYPKDVDSGHYDMSGYLVVRVTDENIKKYQEIYNEQLREAEARKADWDAPVL